MAFCGAYTDQETDAPRIGFGHSSDHQGHRRQFKVAHATTASGIALFGRVVDGARHEGAETGGLLERLRALAEPKRLLLVADSALVTKSNLAAADDAGIRFVSRLPRSFDYEPDALAVPDDAWRTLTYCSERSRRLHPATTHLPRRRSHHRHDRPGQDHRAVFRVLYIYGSEEAGAARASRAKLLAHAEDALARSPAVSRQPRQNPEGRTPRRQSGVQRTRRQLAAHRSAPRRRRQPHPALVA